MSAPATASRRGDRALGRLVEDVRTPHQHLVVVEGRDPSARDHVRALYADGARQGAMFTHRPAESPTTYVHALHLARALVPEPRAALFVGGGTFSAPKGFLAECPDLLVDVVEVDPEVVRVAREHFAAPVDDPRVRAFVEDGRAVIERADREYDVVVLDAFSGRDVPRSLLTLECVRAIRACLAPGGAVALNLIGDLSAGDAGLVQAAARTLGEAFLRVYAFAVRGAAHAGTQNVVLLASDGPEAIPRPRWVALARALESPRSPDLPRLARRLLDPFDVSGALVLRDGRAPGEARSGALGGAHLFGSKTS